MRRPAQIARIVAVVVAIGAISAVVYQTWYSGSPGVGGWTQTQYGLLSPADRDLLVKVRQAGLWEHPTGQQAVERASLPEVRDIAGKISAEHVVLDDLTRNTANQLAVPLPAAPTDQQIAWMNEISNQGGADYDRVFVQRLRQAHGTVLPIIAQVRATTRNDLMRTFATTANEYVSRHIGYLESTGQVDYEALPFSSPGLLSGGTTPADLWLPLLVFVAALFAAVALLITTRDRRGRARRRVTFQPDPPTPPPPTSGGVHRRQSWR